MRLSQLTFFFVVIFLSYLKHLILQKFSINSISSVLAQATRTNYHTLSDLDYHLFLSYGGWKSRLWSRQIWFLVKAISRFAKGLLLLDYKKSSLVSFLVRALIS